MLRPTISFSNQSTKLALGVMVAGLISAGAYAADSQLFLSPNTATMHPGDELSFTVNENSGTREVNAVQASLNYPTDKYDFVKIDSGASAFDVKAQEDGGNGHITVARGKIGTALTGQHEVTKVVLKAKVAGDANVAFSSASALVSSDDNTNIVSNTTGATVSIVAPAPGSPTPSASPSASPTVSPTVSPSTSPEPSASPVTTPTPTSTPVPTVAGTTPTVTPVTGSGDDSDLPDTGPESILGGAAGMGALGYGARAYIRSRRGLTSALRRK